MKFDDFPLVFRVLSLSFPDTHNNDGKASLKRKKSPETMTDTQDVSKYYWFYV